MKEVKLRMNEQDKYEIIKSLVDNNGNKRRAAEKLSCTIRSIDRMINIYKTKGKAGFMHGNRDRKPKNTISQETKETIIQLFETKYYDANWNHFCELLHDYEGIKVSYFVIHSVLTEAGFLSPKCHKATRERKAKELKLKKENQIKLTKNDEDLIVERNILEPEKAHPRIPRSKFFGEKGQMDASKFKWFNGINTTLHGYIDDCTGTINLYFDKEETLNGYYNLLYSVLIDYGVPNKILTDNRTVFNYNSKKDIEHINETFTQFGYACKQLGITLETTSIPQAKGRIERLWNTLQNRLPTEMRIAGIKTIEEANAFITEYCKRFNKRFALPLKNIKSVYENQVSKELINQYLAIISTRIFDGGSSIKYNNKYYQAYDQNNLIPFKKKTKCLVIKCFDGQLYVTVDEKVFELREFQKHKEYSADFDLDQPKEKVKKVYIPPMSHPWKHSSYVRYLQSLENKQNNAYV